MKLLNIINSRFLKTFKFIQIDIKPVNLNLGRWKLETCKNKINKKIDFANNDHCGQCEINYKSASSN